MARIGIDLGVWESAGCYHDVDTLTYVAVKNGIERVLKKYPYIKQYPSAVLYNDRGRSVAVGELAIEADVPGNLVFGAPDLLGQEYKEEMRFLYPNSTGTGEGLAAYKVADRLIMPEEVVSDILAQIIADALDQKPSLIIDEIVIAVPAYLTFRQKNKVLDAAVTAIKKLDRPEYALRILVDTRGGKPDEIENIALVHAPEAAFYYYMAHGGHEHVHAGDHIMLIDPSWYSFETAFGKVRGPIDPVFYPTLELCHITGKKGHGIMECYFRFVDIIKYDAGRRSNFVYHGEIDEYFFVTYAKIAMMGYLAGKRESMNLMSSCREKDVAYYIKGVLSQYEGAIGEILDKSLEDIDHRYKGKADGPKITTAIMSGGPAWVSGLLINRLAYRGLELVSPEGLDQGGCVAEGAARYPLQILR
jgi:hypothetical protein